MGVPVQAMRLLQAIEEFVNDPPRGTPPDALEGLKSASEQLQQLGAKGETPGTRAAQDAAKSAEGNSVADALVQAAEKLTGGHEQGSTAQASN